MINSRLLKLTSIIALPLVLLAIAIMSTNKEAEELVKIGDYIEFGSYNDEPILWRTIHFDEEGAPLLFSEHIITYKSFDGRELESEKKESDLRYMHGSNRWYNSNLREWLNSNDLSVNYTTYPPVKKALRYEFNPYDEEPGFLTNFTDLERSAIKDVSHKTLLVEIDKHFMDGGSELHTFKEDYPDSVVLNYDEAYYQNVTDGVFLLSLKELKEYVVDRNFEWRKTMTRMAKFYERSGRSAQQGNFDYYWLRTPSFDYGYEMDVRVVTPKGKVSESRAYRGLWGGVSPALYLNISSAVIESGNGTIEEPFVISFSNQRN